MGTVSVGSAAIVVAAADLQALTEGTVAYSVDVTDSAGNAAAQHSGSFSYDATLPAAASVLSLLTGDATPELTGSFDSTNSSIASVTINNLVYTTADSALTTNADSWTLTIPAGNELSDASYDVAVTVQDTAGNQKSMTAVNAITVNTSLDTGTSSDDLFIADSTDQSIYLGAGNDELYLSDFRNVASDTLTVRLVSSANGVDTYGVYVPDALANGFSSYTIDILFDPSLVTVVDGSFVGNSQISTADMTLTADYPDVGTDLVSLGGYSGAYSENSSPLAQFDVNHIDTSRPVKLDFSWVTIGNATYVDDINDPGSEYSQYPGIGDGGANQVWFDADATDNGLDTIYGFTVGEGIQENDTVFIGADLASLRGDGQDAELLVSGGTLGSDTGFVVLTQALDALDQSSFEIEALDLVGEEDGDVLYMMATDGTNSKLAQVSYGSNDAVVEFMATFDGLGDLGNFDSTNINGFTIV
jgi:hypothetical protein